MAGLYFAKAANTIEHNGKEIGTIKKGDTQTAVNEKLAQEIENLKASMTTPKVDSKIDSSTVVNTSGFGQASNYLDSGNKVKLQVNTSADGVSVFYDIS
jgi:hypothetical protein